MSYRVSGLKPIECGFTVDASDVLHAAVLTNSILAKLPASLYKSVDFKTSSSIIGAVFCENLADKVHAIVNPIEKGHPDILPPGAADAKEVDLRNYHCGLEIKSTIGGITKGLNLRAGVKRVAHLTGVTWQAHHRDVRALMGLTWDFVQKHETFLYPGITGVFYSANLLENDWGEISGTTGRNTKVCGMRTSGRAKMGAGWMILWDESEYLQMFQEQFATVDLNA